MPESELSVAPGNRVRLVRSLRCPQTSQVARVRQLVHEATGLAPNRSWCIARMPTAAGRLAPGHARLTDTTCRVSAVHDASGQLLGFASYFGCHPVVCCNASRCICGDYLGTGSEPSETGSLCPCRP